MTKDASIAEARGQWCRVVRSVERGRVVRLTRRGKPAAVLVSIAAYERMRIGQGDPQSQADLPA